MNRKLEHDDFDNFMQCSVTSCRNNMHIRCLVNRSVEKCDHAKFKLKMEMERIKKAETEND